jgi:osmotically-inducible protein OsmY
MRAGSFVAGFVLGGVTVALLGRRRRRAVMGDESFYGAGDAAGGMTPRGGKLRQRLRGMVYRAKPGPAGEEIPDDILVERVRAQLERPVSHPRAIDVRAQDGCVFLAGPILAAEVEDLIRQVASIAGVRSIQSELDLHDQPGDVPALQH